LALSLAPAAPASSAIPTHPATADKSDLRTMTTIVTGCTGRHNATMVPGPPSPSRDPYDLKMPLRSAQSAAWVRS
jgi:hypothetical protein